MSDQAELLRVSVPAIGARGQPGRISGCQSELFRASRRMTSSPHCPLIKMDMPFSRWTLPLLSAIAVTTVMVVNGAEAVACALHSSAPPVVGPSDQESSHDDDDQRDEQSTEESSAGDSTREQMSGRIQILGSSGGLRFGDDDTGRAHLSEANMMVHGELWFHPSFGVSASAPLARRTLQLPSGAVERLQGLGDMGLELAWRSTVDAGTGLSVDDSTGGDMSSAQRFGLQLRMGALLPTAPLVRHDDGQWYHPDVQLGAGVVIPRATVGVSYFYSSSTQFFAGADAIWAPESSDGVQRGATARVEPGVQWRPTQRLSLLVSTPLRYQARTRTDGDWEVATGGLLWSVAPQLQWQPLSELSVQAGPNLPMIQALRGDQRESIEFTAATSWRF